MNELERILSKQAHERTEAEVEYLQKHRAKLSAEQLQKLESEPVLFSTKIDNKITVTQKGEDTVMFSRSVPIINNKLLHNGLAYDIASMDMKYYRRKVTINHSDDIHDIVGEVIGLKKNGGEDITIDGVKFYIKENPQEAIFARDMVLAGGLTDLSVETIGPWPDDDGIYKNSKLVGLSFVIVGNSAAATLNSIKQARSTEGNINKLELGIDKIEKTDNNEIDMLIRVTNTRAFEITVNFKDDKGEAQTKTLKANEFVDVPEAEANGVTEQIKNAVEPKKDPEPAPANNDVATIVKNAVEAATKPLQDKIAELDQKIFDNGAKEPEFRQTNGGQGAGQGVKYADMPYKQRHALQIEATWDMLKKNDASKAKIVAEINKVNLEALQKAGKVDNSLTIADFGNFVISRF